MTPLSDCQHDAFDNPAKMACREGNLRVLREAAFLLWEDADRTRLRCDWCELMGATGLLTLDLLEHQGVLPPGGFVGLDLDPGRIENARTSTSFTDTVQLWVSSPDISGVDCQRSRPSP